MPANPPFCTAKSAAAPSGAGVAGLGFLARLAWQAVVGPVAASVGFCTCILPGAAQVIRFSAPAPALACPPRQP